MARATSAERMRKLRSNPVKLSRQKSMEAGRRSATPRYILNLGLHNARKRRSDVTITVDDLVSMWREQGGRCALTGIVMTWGRGKILPTSISMDRIDQNRGYVGGNVRLICYAINNFRGRMTDDEMLAMARILIAKSDDAAPSWRGFGYSANDHILMVN